MTEIPEHLLKRSRERRSSLGEGGDAPAESAPFASTPATTAPATPAVAPRPAAPAVPAAPKAPKPDPAYILAAKTRKKMPFWAMSILGLLPIWGFLYLRGLTPQTEKVTGPLAEGATVYSGCQSCHGGAGEGGTGRQLSEGEVLKTFPHIEDQLNFIYTGSVKFDLAGIAIYGNPNRPGGGNESSGYNGQAMPQQGEKAGGGLTEAQILAVVCHERYTLGGASKDDPKYTDEFAKWCAADSELFTSVQSGDRTFDTAGLGIGTEPRAAKP